ncbi:heavy metal transport/detoxification protein [Chitinophaga pinensis]|uniref:Heavy metal transport/detoxification protein n=1 Tax=Chitinophaga pinensis TaxID=79329 RepID=A0A5C6LSD3_9BACT|nr:heavy metal transport/detoxification protein [Chitinophaga pinensis]TWV97354.1 heavy metal transport/detoxification protein [Chitinophaga pinensis]
MEQQFKTNIKCGGCIATVTPFLNETAGENTWKVDTAAPEKILTVSTDAVAAAAIISAVEKAGFKATQL